MVRDADATRRRLLEAATDEFAAYGIAGARVDRIAEASASNKAQIYHYFGSKDGLFDAVFTAMCVETVAAVPIDAADLPGYAGALFDSYEQRPYVQRLATWYRLERGHTDDPVAAVLASNRAKVAAVAAAQKAGVVASNFSAVDLLGLVLHISGFWSSNVPEYDILVARHSRAHRRRVVVDAVRRLVEP
jgi:AcrR family transcriptional regulator